MGVPCRQNSVKGRSNSSRGCSDPPTASLYIDRRSLEFAKAHSTTTPVFSVGPVELLWCRGGHRCKSQKNNQRRNLCQILDLSLCSPITKRTLVRRLRQVASNDSSKLRRRTKAKGEGFPREMRQFLRILTRIRPRKSRRLPPFHRRISITLSCARNSPPPVNKFPTQT